jgi:hypothetical protein
MTENGTIPDADALEAQQAKWAWFMTWDGYTSNAARNATSHVNAVYNDAYVTTLENMPAGFGCGAYDTTLYPFENGSTMGWDAVYGGMSTPNSAPEHFMGSRSLLVNCSFDASEGGNAGTAEPFITDLSGRVIAAHVLAPLDIPAGSYAMIYIKSGSGWVWQNSAAVILSPGSWIDLYFEMSNPAWTDTAAGVPNHTDIREIGVKIAPPGGFSGTWNGDFHIDSVDVYSGMPTPTATFTATATITPTLTPVLAQPALTDARAFPSLADVRAGVKKITFMGLTAKCRLRIFNLNGELVHAADILSAEGKYEWDVSAGYRIPSGIYVYALTEEKGSRLTGKIAIIK